MLANVNFVKRDGKDYACIKILSVKFNASRVEINMKYKNIATLVSDTIIRTFNANWRMFGPKIGKTIGELFEPVFALILNGVPLQDFFDMNNENVCLKGSK